MAQVDEILRHQESVVGLLADFLEGGHGTAGRATLHEQIAESGPGFSRGSQLHRAPNCTRGLLQTIGPHQDSAQLAPGLRVVRTLGGGLLGRDDFSEPGIGGRDLQKWFSRRRGWLG
jgi:hypothetical protein